MEKDFSKVPATVTIENVLEEVEQVVGELKKEHLDEVSIQLFRINFVEVLKPGDKLILTAQTSEACAYYDMLGESLEGIKVKIEAK